MLQWWEESGLGRADLAVRRSTGAMVWLRDLLLQGLPLAWARAENVRQGEVYIRPARGHEWPVVFLDDVPVRTGFRIAAKYSSLLVATSPQGGCQVWITSSESLCERARHQAQRWLAERIDADLGSVSGEHLGRLAGFKNWKRRGCWVNVIDATQTGSWDPGPALCQGQSSSRNGPSPRPASGGPDRSPSGRDWSWACQALASQLHPETVYQALVRRAQDRGRRDSERYARRTVSRAEEHIRQSLS